MIKPVNIIEGAINSAFSINKSMSEKRMEICRRCPIYSKVLGGMCNSRLLLDPETNDVSTKEKDGYYRGCGCKLSFKTSVASEECPAGKW